MTNEQHFYRAMLIAAFIYLVWPFDAFPGPLDDTIVMLGATYYREDVMRFFKGLFEEELCNETLKD